MAVSNKAFGARGEELAASWYTAEGYTLLDRNWRCREGELDVVAAKGSTLVFCEVKARGGTGFGAPAEAVNPAKQARIRRLASRWLADNRERIGRRSWTIRFDVASVLGRDAVVAEVDVIEGAF